MPRVLTRLHALGARRRVRLTLKAAAEAAALGLTADDVAEILAAVGPRDAAARLRSSETREWLYEFKPSVAGITLYLKVVLRGDCVVVSCHEDQAQPSEEAQDAG